MAGLLSNEKYDFYFQKARLLYKRPEIKASLEVILSIFTIIILIFAAIRPTLTNVVSLQKKIDDQEQVNKKADNKIVQLFNAQKQLTTFGSSLSLFDEAVPDNFAYTDSAKRIEYLAKSNNLAVDSLAFSGLTLLNGGKIAAEWGQKVAVPGTDSLIKDMVSFSINGKPQDIITFLREVENMDRLVVLNNVTLTKQIGLNKAQDSLRAAGQITFYFYLGNL